EGGVPAAVERERLVAREQVQEPGVEGPGEVRVLVPMGGEAVVILHRRHGLVVEVRPRQRVERERRPIADEDQRQREPAHGPRGCCRTMGRGASGGMVPGGSSRMWAGGGGGGGGWGARRGGGGCGGWVFSWFWWLFVGAVGMAGGPGPP